MNRQEFQQLGRMFFKVRQGFLWFLWFFSIFIFAAVIVLAFIWKLPWKVTACLSFVPAAGIFVPRKALPWIWMIPLLAVIAIYIWIKLPDHDSGKWSVYQFEPTPEILEAETIDTSENAAIIYQQVLKDYGESIFGYQFMSNEGEQDTFNGPWTQEQYPKLAMWLKTFDSGIERLIQAAAITECRFTAPRNLKETQTQMQRINQMKGWARLMLRSANLDLGQGRLEQALEKQLALVAIAQHLYQQKTLFDQTGAFHIELLASRALETSIIDHCSDTDMLESIQVAFMGLDSGWARNWEAIILREKLLAKNIAALLYEIDDTGRTRISRTAMYAMQEGLGYRPRRLFFQQHEMSRLAVIGLWLSLPTTPEGTAKIIDKRFDYYSLETQKGYTPEYIPPDRIWEMGLNCRSAIDWLAMQQVKYFWALDGQDKRHDALTNLIQIFVSLKRYYLQHGCWPESLDELDVQNHYIITSDPVHGKAFVYEQVNGNFRLYSLGSNGVNDNGINIPRNNQDDIVFWPRGIWDEAIQSQEDIEMK